MNFENDSDFNAGNIEGVKVLQITETEYNSDYNSVNATFEDVNGFKFYKTFYLNSKKPNEVAYGKKQLDFLAFKALGERCDYSEEDLVGKYIVGEVTLDEYKTEKAGKNRYSLDEKFWYIDGATPEQVAEAGFITSDDELDAELENL